MRDCYVKLLRSVHPDAEAGWGFEGKFFRAGILVSEAELRPSRIYPRIPILLESTLAPAYGPPGYRRCDMLKILWRYERATSEWIEIGRAASKAWEWAIALRPLAIRALEEARERNVPQKERNIGAIAQRISGYLDAELKHLDFTERKHVIAILHDEFAARACA